MNAWNGYYDQKRIERLNAFYISGSFGGGFKKPEEMYWLWGDTPPPKEKTKEEREALAKEAETKWNKAQV